MQQQKCNLSSRYLKPAEDRVQVLEATLWYLSLGGMKDITTNLDWGHSRVGWSTLMLEIDLPQVKTSVVADKKDTPEY